MISLKELLLEKDQKIYLKKGEKPPKGKKIEKGPRGGQYFTGSASEKKAHEKDETPKKSTSSAPKSNITYDRGDVDIVNLDRKTADEIRKTGVKINRIIGNPPGGGNPNLQISGNEDALKKFYKWYDPDGSTYDDFDDFIKTHGFKVNKSAPKKVPTSSTSIKDHPEFGKNVASDRQKKRGTEVYKSGGRIYNVTPTTDGQFYTRVKDPTKKSSWVDDAPFQMIKKSPTKKEAYAELKKYIEKKEGRTAKDLATKAQKLKVLKKYGLEKYENVPKEDYKNVDKHVSPKLKSMGVEMLDNIKNAIKEKRGPNVGFSVVGGQLYVEGGYSKFAVSDYFKKQTPMTKAMKSTLDKYGIQYGKPKYIGEMGVVITMLPIES